MREIHNPNSLMLSYQDSNLDRLDQNQLYYLYTIGQSPKTNSCWQMVCKYIGINTNLQMNLHFSPKKSWAVKFC